MSLEKKGTVIVTPAIRVTDLPALPGDVTDSSRMGKWWDDFRQVLARLIQAKSESQSKEQVVVQAEVTAETPQSEAESKPVDWDDIANKPEKFPPLDHTHKTPWFQVENPLCLSEVDPDTNLATLGFYEQKAATFLAGPLSGPVAKPVFRPLYTGDDANLDGSGAGSTPGDPGTYDDLNGESTGGGAPLGSIAVQARGGAWTKGGFSALDGSSPSQRWLTRTGSGVIRWDGTTGWESGSLACAHIYTRSGSQHYDAATLICSGQIIQTYVGEGPGIGVADYCLQSPVTPSTTTCACGSSWTCGMLGDVQSATPTVGTRTPTSDGWSGAHVATLSDEDTTDNAIARLMGTDPAWTTGQTAIRTVPTTGITGVYRQARYRTEHTEGTGESAVTYPTLEGLEPWQRYRVTVTLESRPIDSAGAPTGEWAESGTRTHYILADLSGEAGLDWQAIEPTAGYETRIASTLVEVA